MRQKELCPGGPGKCNDARLVECTECSHTYKPLDIRSPTETPCPNCGKQGKYIRLPCTTCQEVKLSDTIAQSGFQSLINRAGDLDFLLERPGAAIGVEDMTIEEFETIRLIKLERDRYTEESYKKQQLRQQNQSSGGGRRGR